MKSVQNPHIPVALDHMSTYIMYFLYLALLTSSVSNFWWFSNAVLEIVWI